MQIKVQQGNIASFAADAVVVNLFEGVTSPGGGTGAIDTAMGGAITSLISAGDLRGKSGEFVLVHTMGKLPAPRLIICGLGKSEGFDVDKVRGLSADMARYLRRNRIKHAAIIATGAGIAGLDPEACAAAIAEGTLLGLYRFLRHKKAEEDGDLETLTIVEHDAAKVAALESGVARGVIMAEAANYCRDLANEPANYLTPTAMGNEAEKVAAENGLQVEVYGPDWMREKRMGGILGVAAGSVQEARFIVLRYNGAGASTEPSTGPSTELRTGDAKLLALVGKGITFDTGGISIKSAENMGEMKGDMSGGAAVIAAMGAIAKLRPRINVIGIVPATENMPSGSATRPGDVLETMLGKTIEVINTDAEGRLILADGLAYAREQGATAIVDIATLTGAISVTLGNVAMGAMSNDAALTERVKRAATAAGEKVWELPMWDEYKDLIKSDVADMKNSGGRMAGSITAAMLLKEFVGDTPWVHLDIAGVDFYNAEKGVIVKGASGIPVRTLVNLALQSAEAGASPK
ncbi:MAG TPA: leucyl aminopeptidase [Dehalococcoidia bacterium]|nr:leucyl aminopeptidase [Dehalococcoidia bacterium]